MKKLLLTLLLAASAAHAEIIATMPNKAGGLIYLTNNVTDKCRPLRAMFANSKDGNSLWGCWFLDEVVIHVKWNEGGTSAFPVEAFTIVKKNKGEDL